ncbi:MAG: hypothetical protein GVY18_05830 [Bacteroidetes bacterium]|jgi:aminopeptidase N|nr:hypothetical protein [Bacteroidota bacterium]
MTYRLTLLAILCGLWILCAGPVPAQEAPPPVTSYLADPGTGARSHAIDQQHMVVEVRFVPEERLVRGTVTHIFEPLRAEVDSVYLDGPGIRYQSVQLNGQAVDYQAWPEGISIYPDAPLRWQQTDTLTISYEANPRHGLYFVGWDDPDGTARRQIWTQGQGPGHRHWVPFYDYPNDRMLTETIVTFDSDYEVVSNGELVETTEHDDGTTTWHYRMLAPHAGYLMMLAIGQYDVLPMTSKGGTRIRNYFYPDQPERAAPTYRYTDRMIDVMERETGVGYPWGPYANVPVHNFLHGGMENTTATIFSDAYYVDERAYLDRNYITVNAHEIAHQWFGDLVTMGRNEAIWLHESFATHYAKVIERALLGEQHYQWNQKRERDRALAASEDGAIPIRHTRAGSGRVYYKGSLVLGMLKDVVGKDEFDRVIEHYLTQHAYGPIISSDFFQAFDDVLGWNLDWFFEQWILRGGEPHYRVAYEAVGAADSAATEITVEQIHETGPLVGTFRMPIAVEVHYADGTHARERAWVDGASTTIRVPNPEGKTLDFVLFDPGHRVLKRLTFDRTTDELAAQALRAPLMIDRYDAVVALRPVLLAEKREALHAVFAQEAFPMIRAEVVQQLADDAESQTLLAAALDDPHHAVRGSALRSVPTLTADLVGGVEQALTDSSYQNMATALLRGARYRLDQSDTAAVERYLGQTEEVVGHDHNVRIAWLAVAAQLDRPDALDRLAELASPSYGFRTRVAAFEALEQLGAVDERVAGYLLDAMTHFNRRLRGPATQLFDRMHEQETLRGVLEAAYEAGSWTEREARMLERRFGR